VAGSPAAAAAALLDVLQVLAVLGEVVTAEVMLMAHLPTPILVAVAAVLLVHGIAVMEAMVDLVLS
jgi:hypothetical protein